MHAVGGRDTCPKMLPGGEKKVKMRESSGFVWPSILHRHVLCLISLLHTPSLPPSLPLTVTRAHTPPFPDSPSLPGDSQSSIHPCTLSCSTRVVLPPSFRPSYRRFCLGIPRGLIIKTLCESLAKGYCGASVLCTGQSNAATMSTPQTEH